MGGTELGDTIFFGVDSKVILQFLQTVYGLEQVPFFLSVAYWARGRRSAAVFYPSASGHGEVRSMDDQTAWRYTGRIVPLQLSLESVMLSAYVMVWYPGCFSRGQIPARTNRKGQSTIKGILG